MLCRLVEHRFLLTVFAIVAAGALSLDRSASAASAPLSPAQSLTFAVPKSPSELSDDQTQRLTQAAAALEAWAAEQPLPAQSPEILLGTVRRLVDTSAQVDRALEQVLGLRQQFAALPAGEDRERRACLYLQTTSRLIDLSGRLRQHLRDVIDVAAYYLDPQPQQFSRLLDLLMEKHVAIGAAAMTYMLFDPPADSDARPYSTQDKYRVLNLILVTQQADLMPLIAEFVRQEKNPSLVAIAVELIRRLGLPQKPRPGGDDDAPKPPILAEDIRDILVRFSDDKLPEHLVPLRRELLTWLTDRIEHGVTEDSLRLGPMQVQAGDWLLMRNPSPYNLFSKLSPGLFTHVGIVAVEQGADGIRRFVVVDLPERGAQIPAVTVDTYLNRTLHFVFLRHDDPAVARALGQAAADLIGNESQFDLQFDTRRVVARRGQPLKGSVVHTYCTGLLLLCAQQTSAPRDEFFPLPEAAAGDKTRENLARLGLAIGEDFLSPTGALFSPRLQIVGQRQPLYDPAREVQEAIYDHFAECLIHKTLTPTPDFLQSLRERLASLAKDLPWLAKAMARAHDVSANLDLEAAAKAAAVIEILDDIAEENLDGFAEAQAAVLAGELQGEKAKAYTAEQLARIRSYQQRHADLFRRWEGSRVTPRQVRIELVRFYTDRGRRQLDGRLFSAATDTPSEPN